MENLKRFANWSFIALLIAIIIALIFSYREIAKLSRDNGRAFQDTLKEYKLRDGQRVATIRVLQLDRGQLKNEFLSKDKELQELKSKFAKLQSVAKVGNVTRIEKIPVYYKDTVPCVFERSGTVTEKWYGFKYRSTQKGIELDSLSIRDTITLVTGVKRSWFLGRETITADVIHKNPYSSTTYLQSAKVTNPTPIWKRWYVWLAAGLTGGLLIK